MKVIYLALGLLGLSFLVLSFKLLNADLLTQLICKLQYDPIKSSNICVGCIHSKVFKCENKSRVLQIFGAQFLCFGTYAPKIKHLSNIKVLQS